MKRKKPTKRQRDKRRRAAQWSRRLKRRQGPNRTALLRTLRAIGFQNLKAYLRSGLWRGIEARILESHPRCSRCKAPSQKVRILAADEPTLKGEWLQSLEALCVRHFRAVAPRLAHRHQREGAEIDAAETRAVEQSRGPTSFDRLIAAEVRKERRIERQLSKKAASRRGRHPAKEPAVSVVGNLSAIGDILPANEAQPQALPETHHEEDCPMDKSPPFDPNPQPAEPVSQNGSVLPISSVRWLWDGWIAEGRLHLMAVAGGTCKAVCLCDLIARITSGRDRTWPDGSPVPRPADVVLIAYGRLDTEFMPNLEAAGADLDRVHAFPSMQALSNNADNLDGFLASHPDVRAVFIDPLVAYLLNVCREKRTPAAPAEAVASTERLAAIAKCRGVAIIGNVDFSSASANDILQSWHSITFAKSADVVMGIGANRKRPPVLQFFQVKNALQSMPKRITYRIVDQRVEWGAAPEMAAAAG